MKIKQTILAVTTVFVLSTVGALTFLGDTTHAMPKDRFVDILCADFQGPSTTGGTLSEECRKDARDGVLSKKWYDKVIKFADWKDKSGAALYKFIGKTPPGSGSGNEGPSGEGSECSTAVLPKSFCDGDSGEGIFGILTLVIRILAAGVGLVAVGGIIYAAILYASAENNPSQTKKAKDIIANVVIGIVSFALMWAFLEFIIPGGVFN